MNASLPRVADDASPGEKLWYYRELREMTREELGEKLGLKAGGVQNLEDRNNAIHYKNALKIGEILDIDPETQFPSGRQTIASLDKSILIAWNCWL